MSGLSVFELLVSKEKEVYASKPVLTTLVTFCGKIIINCWLVRSNFVD
jgi:hypothetical protein